MYKFLEYGDAHYVVDYIYESDIYDEEKFLFAPDVDILKTSELDIRNSLFTYFMQILVLAFKFLQEEQYKKYFIVPN